MRIKDGHMCDYCKKALFGSTVVCICGHEYHPSCSKMIERFKEEERRA